MHSSDRRQAFRCPVPAEQQQVLLLAGTSKLPVRLIDESASGFAILSEQRPGVEVDQIVYLRTAAGCSEAQVVDMRREGTAFRIGLTRLRDVPPPSPVKFTLTSLFSLRRPIHKSPAWIPLPSFGLGIVLLIGAVICLLTWRLILTAADLPFGIPLAPSQPKRHLGAPRSLETEMAVTRAELRRRLFDVPGPEVFSLPGVVRALGLTPDQQARLRQISATAHFTEESGDLRSAVRQALGVLSEEQKQRWRDLLIEATDPDHP